MSTVEGGPFICYVHDNFTTTDVKEWNAHCQDGNHFEEGTVSCGGCGQWLKIDKLPFHPYDDAGHKNIFIECPDCQIKRLGNVKVEVLK